MTSTLFIDASIYFFNGATNFRNNRIKEIFVKVVDVGSASEEKNKKDKQESSKDEDKQELEKSDDKIDKKSKK